MPNLFREKGKGKREKYDNVLSPFTFHLSPKTRAFTLIELMVTTSIFTIITLIVMINYPKANGAIALRLLSNDLALSIREAQVYGVSVQGTRSVVGDTTYFADYGMYFSKNEPADYFLFADLDLNGYPKGTFDVGQENCGSVGSTAVDQKKCVQNYKLEGVNIIKKICATTARTSVAAIDLTRANCVADSGLGLDELTILFKRPNPEAIMSGKLSSSGSSVSDISTAGILIGKKEETDPNKLKMIVVWGTGQITVQ